MENCFHRGAFNRAVHQCVFKREAVFTLFINVPLVFLLTIQSVMNIFVFKQNRPQMMRLLYNNSDVMDVMAQC